MQVVSIILLLGAVAPVVDSITAVGVVQEYITLEPDFRFQEIFLSILEQAGSVF
jgi:hypothetical protein